MTDTFLRIGERFGVPVVILVAVLWMAREAATSLHTTVVVPIVTSHTEFLESTRETLSELSHTQEKQAETLSEIADGQRQIQKTLSVR